MPWCFNINGIKIKFIRFERVWVFNMVYCFVPLIATSITWRQCLHFLYSSFFIYFCFTAAVAVSGPREWEIDGRSIGMGHGESLTGLGSNSLWVWSRNRGSWEGERGGRLYSIARLGMLNVTDGPYGFSRTILCDTAFCSKHASSLESIYFHDAVLLDQAMHLGAAVGR